MSRIIIENRSSAPDEEALLAVREIISWGRISGNGESYCYATTFKNGTAVYTDVNKRSDRFVVVDDNTPYKAGNRH